MAAGYGLLLGGLVVLALNCADTSWRQVPLTAPAYDNETQDLNVAPTNAIRTGDYEAATPTQIAGATTVTTPQLRDMMLAPRPPVLLDVIGGDQTESLPGAVWLRGAGRGAALDDAVQPRLAAHLQDLTGGDRTRAVVCFCLSQTCWLSHNVAVRAVALGYRHVLWYRGGRSAWQAAGLALEPVRALTF